MRKILKNKIAVLIIAILCVTAFTFLSENKNEESVYSVEYAAESAVKLENQARVETVWNAFSIEKELQENSKSMPEYSSKASNNTVNIESDEGVLCMYDGLQFRVRLHDVRSWVYNIKDTGTKRQRKQLTETLVDMYVIEPLVTERWNRDFDISGLISEIKRNNVEQRGVEPLVLAYVNIGQAENWRWYWQKGWKLGNPEWIAGRDPSGWPGCYPVLFWHEEWQKIVLEIVEKTLAAGFDGIYMDWIEIFVERNVLSKAKKQGITETHEFLFDFFERIKTYAREESIHKNPEFLMIAQNAPFLFEKNPARYKKLIDAIAMEGIWYSATGGMDSWNDPKGFNMPANKIFPGSTEAVLNYLKVIRNFMPVFNVEYAQNTDGLDYAARAIEKSAEYGFIVTVARRDLSRISTMPPPPVSMR
jgi:cysteinyl-tRNA synthetase